MASNVHFLDGGQGDGGGPGETMLEQRVARLEEDVKDLKSDVRELRSDVNDLKISMAEVGGKLDILIARTPTFVQLWGMIFGSWIAGTTVLFGIMRILQP